MWFPSSPWERRLQLADCDERTNGDMLCATSQTFAGCRATKSVSNCIYCAGRRRDLISSSTGSCAGRGASKSPNLVFNTHGAKWQSSAPAPRLCAGTPRCRDMALARSACSGRLNTALGCVPFERSGQPLFTGKMVEMFSAITSFNLACSTSFSRCKCPGATKLMQ